MMLEPCSTDSGPPSLARSAFPACRAPYHRSAEPALVSVSSWLVLPSPFPRPVGIRYVAFEACSSFTRKGLPAAQPLRLYR